MPETYDDRVTALRMSLESEFRQLRILLELRQRFSTVQRREGSKQPSSGDPMVKLWEATPEEAASNIDDRVREQGPIIAKNIETLARQLAEQLSSESDK